MNINFAILSFLAFVIVDVILWYILNLYNIKDASVIAVFIAIIFFTSNIAYFTHGKGIIYPKKETIKNQTQYRVKNYQREKLLTFSPTSQTRSKGYIRSTFKEHKYSREELRNNF